MTHDPLCPIQPPVVGSGSTDPAIRTMPESAGVPCQCSLIAKVRADTLNQAREAVVAVPWQSSMLGATVMRVDVVAAVDSLVATATPRKGTKAG